MRNTRFSYTACVLFTFLFNFNSNTNGQELVTNKERPWFSVVDENYAYSYKKVNWFTAHRVCSLFGFKLAGVQNHDKHTNILDFLRKKEKKICEWDIFLDLTNMGKPANFYYSWNNAQGRRYELNNWVNNIFNKSEECMVINQDKKWENLSCFSEHAFLCESRKAEGILGLP